MTVTAVIVNWVCDARFLGSDVAYQSLPDVLLHEPTQSVPNADALLKVLPTLARFEAFFVQRELDCERYVVAVAQRRPGVSTPITAERPEDRVLDGGWTH
jgi:hypothetical protein